MSTITLTWHHFVWLAVLLDEIGIFGEFISFIKIVLKHILFAISLESGGYLWIKVKHGRLH